MTLRDRSYTLGGTIMEGVRRALAEVHTAIPGRIVRYDASTQQADVLPLVQVNYYNEAGDEVLESLPVVPSVPVIFPGAGGYAITFPVKGDPDTGDTCLLLFSEASIDEWLAKGGKDVAPADERRFHLSDGIALLGLRDFAHARPLAPTDRMMLGQEQGLALHIDGTSIRVGDNDAPNLDAATLGTAATTALSNIVSWLSSHTHPVTGAVAGASATPPPTIPNVKSAKVLIAK